MKYGIFLALSLLTLISTTVAVEPQKDPLCIAIMEAIEEYNQPLSSTVTLHKTTSPDQSDRIIEKVIKSPRRGPRNRVRWTKVSIEALLKEQQKMQSELDLYKNKMDELDKNERGSIMWEVYTHGYRQSHRKLNTVNDRIKRFFN